MVSRTFMFVGTDLLDAGDGAHPSESAGPVMKDALGYDPCAFWSGTHFESGLRDRYASFADEETLEIFRDHRTTWFPLGGRMRLDGSPFTVTAATPAPVLAPEPESAMTIRSEDER